MPWSVKYKHNTKIVEVTYTGVVTFEDMRNAVIERIRKQNEHKSLFVLINCSLVKHIVGGIFVVHDLPNKIYENAKVHRHTCHALLLSKFPKTHSAFFHYETACINRGWRVRLFENRKDAFRWLQETMMFENSSEWKSKRN